MVEYEKFTIENGDSGACYHRTDNFREAEAAISWLLVQKSCDYEHIIITIKKFAPDNLSSTSSMKEVDTK